MQGRSQTNRTVCLAWILLCATALGLSAAAQAATLVHRPYLQNMRADRVTIVWSARENLPGVVQYSNDQSFSQISSARVRAFPVSLTQSLDTAGALHLSYSFYQYQADLTGLAPGTQYFYQVLMDGSNITPNVTGQFRTAAPGSFSFLVFGDSGLGSPGQRDIALQMNAEKPDLVLHVGDIAYENGTFEEFTGNYFEYYWPLMNRVPFFTVAGNHEYQSPMAGPYIALQAVPNDTVPDRDRGRYYSFDWGDIHFVALDSDLLTSSALSSAMLAWLENDLASTGAKWRVAYFHHLPYPISHHLDDPLCAATRTQFVPILERHGVQLVLTGHEHTYQRSKPMRAGTPVTAGPGTTYITTGGGGGELHPVVPMDFLAYEKSDYHYLRVEADGSRITVHAIGRTGKEFDRVSLAFPSLNPPVVNAASFSTAVASGGLISIFGQGLATDAVLASGLPWPTSLAGSTVTLNGTLMPLIYTSPQQINAQIPLDASGSATLRVSTASGFSEATLAVSDTAPAIFGVLHSNGTAVSSAFPARGGEALSIYMTGLGQVDRPIASGQPAPADPLLHVVTPVQVELGDVSVTPLFAGLTPGLAGVYQVNIVVPPDLQTRVYPLRVVSKGSPSNIQSVQVQSRVP
ncbi:MAG: hypothetical protein C5B51_01445 [Terriglobia bacterium]|nr:MAG: hypothetical protein C5B51_01445 [Terriglobia bacterium]